MYSLASNASRYQTENTNEIIKNIITKLNSIHLNTTKQEQFKTWIEGSKYISEFGYKEDKDFLYLINLAYNMNNEGKYRRLKKEEYISKMIKKQ